MDEYVTTHNNTLAQLIKQNQRTFGVDSERGLCNRLDTPTAGLLYFAKTQETFDTYRQAQANGTLVKYYLGTIT